MSEVKDPLRIRREKKTVSLMIGIFCRAHHGSQERLCSECESLCSYAFARLLKCPFGANKPTCAQCPIHCYKPDMRERIRRVMRYSGPRMLKCHPILAVLHMWDALRSRWRPPKLSVQSIRVSKAGNSFQLAGVGVGGKSASLEPNRGVARNHGSES